MQLHFQVGAIGEAEFLIKKFHYSHRMPANIQFCGTWHVDGGLLGDRGEAIAACLFSIPPTRWSENVLELSRLVRTENVKISLTGLIALCCDELRHAGSDLLVSFADSTHSHHGGIYQAASWSFAELREKRMDGLLIDGDFVPGRSCNSKWGTRSPSKLSEILPAERKIEPHFDQGKYLYWRALNKNGQKKAQRLGLAAMPYPKPNRVQQVVR